MGFGHSADKKEKGVHQRLREKNKIPPEPPGDFALKTERGFPQWPVALAPILEVLGPHHVGALQLLLPLDLGARGIGARSLDRERGFDGSLIASLVVFSQG